MSMRARQWKLGARAAGNTLGGKPSRASVQGLEAYLLKQARKASWKASLIGLTSDQISRLGDAARWVEKTGEEAAEAAARTLKSPSGLTTAAALTAAGVSAVGWYRHSGGHNQQDGQEHEGGQKGRKEGQHKVQDDQSSGQHQGQSQREGQSGREGQSEPRGQSGQPESASSSRQGEQQGRKTRGRENGGQAQPASGEAPYQQNGVQHEAGSPHNQAADGGGVKDVPHHLYLYGIIGPVAADWEPGTGVDDPPGSVFLIRYGNIAALVSEVDAGRLESENPRALRHDMQAHHEVQGRILPFAPLLPVRFGVALPHRDSVRGMLEAHYWEFANLLDRLHGKVEVELRIKYQEQPVVEELAREDPRLLPSQRWGHTGDQMNYSQRIELGEGVMMALRTKKLQESQRVMAQLSPVVEEQIVHDQPEDELTMLKAAFLLDHRMLAAFEEKVDKIRDRERDRLEVSCIGPLPAYSFIDQTVLS